MSVFRVDHELTIGLLRRCCRRGKGYFRSFEFVVIGLKAHWQVDGAFINTRRKQAGITARFTYNRAE